MDGKTFKAIRGYNRIYKNEVEKLFNIKFNYIFKLEDKNEIPAKYVKILGEHIKVKLWIDDDLKEYLKEVPERYFNRKKKEKIVWY